MSVLVTFRIRPRSRRPTASKSALIRRLRTTRGVDRLVPNPPATAWRAGVYRSVKETGGPADRRGTRSRFLPTFIMNQNTTLPDQKPGGSMATAARRRLGHSLEYLGHVESDETVWLAARRRRPLSRRPRLQGVEEHRAAGAAPAVAGRRARTRAPRDGPAATEEEQTYYEVLETEPGVSDEEIRRAYRTVKDNYASGSMVIAGLYDEHELAALHARINAAHDTFSRPIAGASTTSLCPRRIWRVRCGRRHRSRARRAGPRGPPARTDRRRPIRSSTGAPR